VRPVHVEVAQARVDMNNHVAQVRANFDLQLDAARIQVVRTADNLSSSAETVSVAALTAQAKVIKVANTVNNVKNIVGVSVVAFSLAMFGRALWNNWDERKKKGTPESAQNDDGLSESEVIKLFRGVGLVACMGYFVNAGYNNAAWCFKLVQDCISGFLSLFHLWGVVEKITKSGKTEELPASFVKNVAECVEEVTAIADNEQSFINLRWPCTCLHKKHPNVPCVCDRAGS